MSLWMECSESTTTMNREARSSRSISSTQRVPISIWKSMNTAWPRSFKVLCSFLARDSSGSRWRKLMKV